MSKVDISIPHLTMLYVSGINLTDTLNQEADIINAEIKKIEEAQVFEGNNGEKCRELLGDLAKVNLKLAKDTRTVNIFLDTQVGNAIDINRIDQYDGIDEAAKKLIVKRLKK